MKRTRKIWEIDEINKFKLLYPDTQTIDLCKTFNRGLRELYEKASHLNLKKSKKFKSYLIGIRNKKYKRDLSVENLEKIAKNFKSVQEFKFKDSSAYHTAQKLGILKNITSHMENKNINVPQLILKQICESILECQCNYNNRKKIYPFELDVYFPQYNLAFEYDSKYWHQDIDRESRKLKKIKESDITVIQIKEMNKKYELEIKNQLIDNLHLINSICKKNISKEHILNFKISSLEFITKSTIECIDECSSYKEFKEKYPKLFKKINKHKLNHILFKFKDFPKQRTIESITHELSNYKTLKDLLSNNKKLYTYIRRHDLQHLIKHLPKLNYKNK
jgi:hypothetical protein